uniref:Uncharacterized protein n=2 Tax=Gloeothece TaxID=28070 RepID=E0UMP5_GLOV7|nr:hypothetical protein Cyan7822_6441 [Gloeothece verrucosa PCC 7822]
MAMKNGKFSSSVSVSLRYQAEPDTEDGVIINYIQQMSQKVSTPYKRTTILECWKNHWLPYAYEENGSKTPEQLRQLAIDCAEQLRAHAQKLEQRYGCSLPSPSPITPSTPSTNRVSQPEQVSLPSEVKPLINSLDFNL